MTVAEQTLGVLYVIAAPSGGGKTTLVNALLKEVSGLHLSISYTTRPKRPSEVDGQHYFFVDKAEFQGLIDDQALLEYADVYEHYYGTSRAWVESRLQAGDDVILEIDWQGAAQIKRLFSRSVTIFVIPPSRATLESRLRKRAEDSEAVIKYRMDKAREEMLHYNEFDYLVINDVFEMAVSDTRKIIEGERLRLFRQQVQQRDLLADLVSD